MIQVQEQLILMNTQESFYKYPFSRKCSIYNIQGYSRIRSKVRGTIRKLYKTVRTLLLSLEFEKSVVNSKRLIRKGTSISNTVSE